MKWHKECCISLYKNNAQALQSPSPDRIFPFVYSSQFVNNYELN